MDTQKREDIGKVLELGKELEIIWGRIRGRLTLRDANTGLALSKRVAGLSGGASAAGSNRCVIAVTVKVKGSTIPVLL